MDKMIVGVVIFFISFGIMMYILILIVVFVFKSVKFIVDKIFLKEFFDKCERLGLVFVIFVNKFGYFEFKNEKICC